MIEPVAGTDAAGNLEADTADSGVGASAYQELHLHTGDAQVVRAYRRRLRVSGWTWNAANVTATRRAGRYDGRWSIVLDYPAHGMATVEVDLDARTC